MSFDALSAYASLATAVGQVISAVAVVISLIYLARQLRHNTQSVQAQTFIAVLANNISVMSAIYLQPEFAKLIDVATRDPSSLTAADTLRWDAFMRTMFRQLDNVYHQSKAGALETDIWPGYEQILISWLRQPGCLHWFEENLHFFSASLRNHYVANIRPQISQIKRQSED